MTVIPAMIHARFSQLDEIMLDKARSLWKNILVKAPEYSRKLLILSTS